MKTQGVYQIVAPHFSAGLTVGGRGTVVKADPMIAWAMSKTIGEIKFYCRLKEWKITWLRDIQDESLTTAPAKATGTEPATPPHSIATLTKLNGIATSRRRLTPVNQNPLRKLSSTKKAGS